jgi:hypothetical protein
MRTYENLLELARICARQAWLSSTPQVAGELWRMAKEYQARAAEHDSSVELDIGDPPPWAKQVSQPHKFQQAALHRARTRHSGPH